jgi:bile acid:Na+ symporter, BASS family
MFLKRLFENSELVMITCIVLPLLFAFKLDSYKDAIDILLGIIMFFSIRPFFKHKMAIRQKMSHVVMAVFFNYILLSGIYLLLGYMFFRTDVLFTGYILLAIVPPAIAIVPLCYIAKCDTESADVAMFISFLLSIVIVPSMMFLIFGKSISMLKMFEIMAVLIIIPLILAYLTRNVESRIFSYSKAITNFLLGLVIILGMSLNRHVFFTFDTQTIYIYLISIIAILGTGLLVYLLTKYSYGKGEAITYTLYATHKNVGSAITIALTFFAPITAVPAIVSLVVQVIFFIIFEKYFLRMNIRE